jgi:uncharacterized protein (TIGR00369 family)
MTALITPTAEEVLQQWLQREADIRQTLLPHGILPLHEVLPLSGLQLMQGMMTGRTPPATFSKTLDFLLVEVSEGKAVFQGQPGAAHLNPMGTVHGGWFSTLLDSALGCAVHSMLPPGRAYTTAELNVNMVKALTPKVSRVRAEAEVVHCGKQLATAQARLVGADGTLYAHATATCLVFDIPTQLKP